MNKERRSSQRFQVNGEELFVMDHAANKIATVRNLSLSGLQMRYTTQTPACHKWAVVDIVSANQRQVIVPALSCRPAYDIASLMEDGKFSRGAFTRTCGVQFERMDRQQKSQIKQLFDSIAQIEASDAESIKTDRGIPTVARVKGGPECK